MSSSSRAPWVIGLAVLGAVVKFAAIGARENRYDSYRRYDSSRYALGSPYDKPLYDKPLSAPEIQRILDQTRAKRVQPALEQPPAQELVSDCATEDPQTLQAELLYPDAAMARMHLALFTHDLPTQQAPASVTSAGFTVLLRDADGRYCTKATRDQLNAAVSERTDVLAPLEDGAWYGSSRDDVAASAALDIKGLRALHSKGPLLAFLPSDNHVAFADSANPRAVKAAAAYAAEVDVSGDRGCISSSVYVLKPNGAWAPWAAPAGHPAAKELGAARRAADECLRSQVLSSIADADEILAGRPSDEAASTPDDALRTTPHDAIATRSATDGGTLQTISDTTRQVVSVSDRVQLYGTSTSLEWSEFRKQYRKRLSDFEFGGSKLDGYWVLQPVASR